MLKHLEVDKELSIQLEYEETRELGEKLIIFINHWQTVSCKFVLSIPHHGWESTLEI